jgi:hypothetical protein
VKRFQCNEINILPSDNEDINQRLDNPDRFLFPILLPGQLYLEINPPTLGRIHKIARHLENTGLIIISQSHNFDACPSVPDRNIICLQTHQNLTVDEILAASLSLPQPIGIFPAIVKISQAHPTLLTRTRVLKAAQSLFYLELDDAQETTELIDTFISEGNSHSPFLPSLHSLSGYDLFWHLTFSSDLNQFLPSSFNNLLTQLSPSFLSFALVAMPISHSNPLFSQLSQLFPSNLFFSFQSGKYHLSDYDLQYVLHLTDSSTFEPQSLITSLTLHSLPSIKRNSCLSSDPVLSHLWIAPIFSNNHLRSLNEIVPHSASEFCSNSMEISNQLPSFRLSTLDLPLRHFIHDLPVGGLIVQSPRIFELNIGSEASFLRFPSHLTSSGLQVYLSYYCQQLLSLPTSSSSFVSLNHCKEIVSQSYHEVLLSPPPPSPSHTQNDHHSFFDPIQHWPFQTTLSLNSSSSYCSDSLWCDHTKEFQHRLYLWQNPDSPLGKNSIFKERAQNGCSNSKFLVFEPFTSVHGIGSIILQIAIALRYALCHGRILILTPSFLLEQQDTHRRWMSKQCDQELTSFLDCYFLSLTNCQLIEEEIIYAPYTNGADLENYPLKNTKVVRLIGLPTGGACSVCGSEWSNDFTFFHGLSLSGGREVVPSHQSTSEDNLYSHLKYFHNFLGKTKLPWLAQMTRYLLRPKRWFAQHLQDIVSNRLSSPNKKIPRPFASVHVRYGEKVLEVAHRPLTNYLDVVIRKAPHIQHIFISTETESVIHRLIR